MIPIYLLSGDQPFRVDYLVIAGGGGGGSGASEGGAGGGAGGYLCSVPSESSGGPSSNLELIEFIGGQTLTITVGAGGGNSVNGQNSVFGLVAAVGGGRGASYSPTHAADPGGSGGGGANENPTGGTGTANQGNDGGGYVGPGANFPATYTMAGGGGASQVGNTNGGARGGDGLASSITGTSIIRAGGGGGGSAQSVQVGGSGGGGSGGSGDLRISGPAPTAGQIQTGSGGGGGGGPGRQGANGGSGIVVLRYPSLARIIDFIAPGLTYSFSDDGTFKRYVFTAGTGNIRF